VIDIIPNWHPVFVHFTIALLPVAALLYAASALTPRSAASPYLLAAARINLGIGILLTLVTILAGIYALAHSEFHNTAQLAAVHVHRRAAIATGITWLLLALWDARATLKARRPGALFVLLSLAAVVPVAATGWLGAELVYRHAVGVQQQ
jgi:uncharacterized membrane protein